MSRSLLVGVLLVFVAALVAALWLSQQGEQLPPPHAGDPTAGIQDPAAAATSAQVGDATPGAAAAAVGRESLPTSVQDRRDDPEIRAALTGFRGRVVDHRRQPVAACGVRIYRGALDSILRPGVDVFADQATLQPDYVAGEAQTAADGTFTIAGVWPRAFYLLFAGIGTDATTHQVLAHTPPPGEILDLGDIELPDAAVIVGTVVDDEGEPVPGALVRAADLPGSLTAFFPAERFDPKGAILVREAQSPIRVVELPPWVERVFEHLPIPSTKTAGDGRFRLTGVVPGSNLLATTKNGFLSDMKPSVMAKAGQEKDVGKIRLKRGEDLAGRVLDTAGKPVAGAEVLAGSTLGMVPFDFAQRIEPSDAEGRFAATGFAPGKVTVAARRGPGHTWVLAEPQPILGDVVVTLPATLSLLVSVRGPDGKMPAQPRLKLLSGKAGDGAAEMAVFGFVPAVPIADRTTREEDGRLRIGNLLPGRYTLLVDAEGCAVTAAAVELTTEDAVVSVALEPQVEFLVRVLGPEDQPVRSAAIYAQEEGRAQVFDMPMQCGHTDAAGRLRITQMRGEALRVSAEHPRFGVVHGRIERGAETVLRFSAPGAIHGVLTENGKPVEPGRYTVSIEARGSGGPFDQVPSLATPALDGAFVVKALQPGGYRVGVIKSLDALRSPGSIFTLAQDMFLSRNLPSEQVEVVAGQTAEVRLDAGEVPFDGPTGHVFGSVTIDGKVAAGYLISGWAEGRRLATKVDERGRFDLGQVPAGQVHVQVMGGSDGFLMGVGRSIWAEGFELKAGDARELVVDLQTTSITGHCFHADGSPAAGVFVQARGRPKGVEDGREVWLGEVTDAQGRFHFAQATAGVWRFEVHGGDDERGGRGRLDGVVAEPGLPVTGLRIELQPGTRIEGRVDLGTFSNKQPQWIWLSFHKPPPSGTNEDVGEHVDGTTVDRDTGAFRVAGLDPGTYGVRLHASLGDNEHQQFRCADIVVPIGGVRDLQLVPVPMGPPLRDR